MKKYRFHRFGVILILIAGLALNGCNGGSSQTSLNFSAILSITSRKGACLQMTTFCENDPETTLQYNYAENDGEATASGGKSNDTACLDNFINDVQHCTDPIFKQAQNYELDQMYWNPAVSMANNIGARYPITLAFIYDMCVNHGAERAQKFIDQTNSDLGSSPATGINEQQWLTKCINIRYNYLVANEGSAAACRCNAFLRVLQSGNVNLNTPFIFNCYGDICTIDGNVGY